MKNMPKAKKEEKIGKILASWQFPEFTKYERGPVWHIVAGLVVLGTLAYSIMTANFLFAVIIVIAVIIWTLQLRKDPQMIDFSISDKGVTIGSSFYKYESLKKFWIIYNPPETKSLYFDFKSVVKPAISIELQSQNPLKMRELLLQFLDEDLEKDDEPASEIWRKALKL